MAAQLLFYEAAVPVTVARHGNWSIQPSDYSFSKGVNSVPLTSVEFAVAASEYTIVFTGESGAIMPAAVLGVRSAENLYLKDHGQWDARYVPAFVRRYPFVFSSTDQGKTFALCIDEAYAGFNQEGRGQRLFDDEKRASTYTGSVLDFLKQYQLEFQRTQAFCRTLEELGLLEPMTAQVSLPSGERVGLAGFQAVNRDKLKALAPQKLAELVLNDGLELVYLHLLSMRNFRQMPGRLNGLAAPRPEPVPAPAPAAVEAEAQVEAEAKPVKPARTAAAKSRKKAEGKPAS